MYTSIALLALSGLVGAIPLHRDPDWLSDYRLASQQGKKEKKPLAVFIGSGEKGYRNVVTQGGKLNREVKEILAGKYICVYLDTDQQTGRQWASAFRMDRGIVISDRTGALQALRYDGSLARTDLTRYLKRFSDPELVVKATERNRSERLSYYPPDTPAVQQNYYPGNFGGNFGGFGGGRSC